MKDLYKNVIYDLSDLNKEERTELFDYLLSVDKSYSSSGKEFKKTAKDLIYFTNYNQWFWCDWDYAPDSFNESIKKERSVVNAKTLFDPKVNIINPTESNCDKTIEKDSILEVILKNKLLELRENVTDLENLLLHNTNLNDYSKTEMMKNILFINRQSDVLNKVLKDYEIEKLKQQCEN